MVLKNEAILANRYHICVVKLGSLDRFAVQRCGVRAFKVFHKIDLLYPSDPGMMTRDGMIVNDEIVVDLSPDSEIVSTEIDRARALAMELDEECCWFDERVGHDAHF